MRLLFVLLASLTATATARAADAVADLLRLAPKDTTVALVVRDLRGHAGRLLDSPFAKWFPDSKIGKALFASKDWNTLATVEKFVAAQLGASGRHLLDGVLGDGVVFAYRNRDDSSLILLRAGKPELLATVLDRLNAAQKESGEITAIREKKHGEATYTERERSDGRHEFYWASGGTFAFSQTEASVREAIDRAAKPGPAPLVDALEKLKLTTAVVTAVFHPRALDGDLAAALAGAKDASQKAFLTQFQRLWTACDAVAVSVEVGRTLDVALNVAVNPKLVPDDLRPILAPGIPSALWSAIPTDALFATAGTLDLPKLLAALRSFLSDDGKAGLTLLLNDHVGPVVGKRQLPSLLAGVGPDVALWVTAPPAGAASWTPVGTVALKVGDGAEVGPLLVSALDAVAQVVRIEYNRTHNDQLDLKTARNPDGDVKSLVNDAYFPPGVRPAFGVRHGHLIVSTSDAAVTAFARPGAAPASANGLIARASLARLRGYLTAREKDIIPAVAAMTGTKPAELRQQFGHFRDVLELFESVELRRAGTADVVRLMLSVTPARPLAK